MNPHIKQNFSAMCAQDRYKRLQMTFDKSEGRDQLRSGVETEAGEMKELLLMVRAVTDEMEAGKGMERILDRNLDEEKERVGRELWKWQPIDQGRTTQKLLAMFSQGSALGISDHVRKLK